MYKIWLGRWFVVQTLGEEEQDESEIKEEIRAIRGLLDE
jgi:hypothetical protein